jgi:segregation and condensation protein A
MPSGDAILDQYQLRLPVFEGPLDVLLRLIERSQLAIADVSLVAVTEQFLAHVRALDEAPPAVLAEFSAVGSRLVLLKSRSLLPRPAVDEEGEGEGLVQQLIEYRAVKEAAVELGRRDTRGEGAFGRGAGAVAGPPATPPRLARHEPVALAQAIRRRLSVLPGPRDGLRLRRLISLREMIERVMGAITTRGTARFSAVAAGCESRHEVLTAFLALLVLMRRRVLDAEQDALFGEITIRHAAPAAMPAPAMLGEAAADD